MAGDKREPHSHAHVRRLTREEICKLTLSQRELAERYDVGRLTNREWQNRDSTEDPFDMLSLKYDTAGAILYALKLRPALLPLYLPVDDLLYIAI